MSSSHTLARRYRRHVMDNMPAHEGARIEHLMKSARAELRYPPYSPDMNPIEKIFGAEGL